MAGTAKHLTLTFYCAELTLIDVLGLFRGIIVRWRCTANRLSDGE